ncbi:type VII secretion protein EsaA [Shouchella lonarensis]|uniref:Type VII secretion protein EsaA, N-terminal domain-containing protein n=1 Tax=Shouchella lonarensis TaxID=1464122 RepID=A0A1G6HNY4_9BACI|nr:type VII secretion protein EsaA [Shouchella lonarensis]SDB95853.1 type VII secretion protein EsaA, N-terminal domain-containing protein [Shouchella lonarensis]
MRNKRNIITLLIAIALIIGAPLVFFNYIGSEPMFRPKNTTDKIAIVNEDDGYKKSEDSETTRLGEDLILTIDDQGSEYEWPVVSRSEAQQGLEAKDYDAVIYIPTSFSSSLMSFKEAIPQEANIRYEMHPNLNAKNQERVQKELEAAQQRLNSQVSAMYWRYVSSEVFGVQQNFDEVLEKEKKFLDEIYGFYAPSSKELTAEIDRQRERINLLFVNSGEATSLSDGSKAGIEEAQQMFEKLTENIDAYLKHQEQLTTTLLKTDSENDVLINKSATEFQSLLQEGKENVRQGQTPFQPRLDNTGNDVLAYFQLWDQNTTNFGQNMNDFGRRSETQFMQIDEEVDQLTNYGYNAIEMYNRNVNSVNFVSARTEVKALREQLTEGSGGNELEPPGRPEGELEGLSEDFLSEAKSYVNNLKQLLVTLKPEEKVDPDPPPTDPVPPPVDEDESESETKSSEEDPPEASDPAKDDQTDQTEDTSTPKEAWQKATDLLRDLETELNERRTNIDEHSKVITEFYEYIEQLLSHIAILEAHAGQDGRTLIEEITQLEKWIVARDPHKMISPLPIDQPIESRDIRALTQYYGSLTRLALWLDLYLSDEVNDEKANASVERYLKAEELRDRLTRSKENVSSFMERAQEIEQMKKFSQEAQTEFDQFVTDTTDVLGTLEKDIAEQQQFVLTELNNTLEKANKVNDQLQNGRLTLEVEPGPIEGLDGTLVQTNQQSSLSEVEQLRHSVKSLGEHQDDLIGSTEDMFTQVSSVQSKSDDLNDRWKNSVGTTNLVYDDMNDILNNAINGGHHNDYVYKYLSNPVHVAGEQVEGPTETVTPPVVMLVIVLIVSLLIGYLAHHFGYLPVAAHLSLYAILSIITGLVISMYGLNIYKMNDMQTIQWTIVTVLLMLATSGVVRLLLMIGPWMGWLGSVLITFVFVSPLLDTALPNFHTQNPIAELYLSIQHSTQSLFVPGVLVLSTVTLLAVMIPIVQHIKANKLTRSEEEDHDM